MNVKIFIIIIATALVACSKNSKEKGQPCGQAVIIDPALYENVNTTNYVITDAIINGNCLDISFGSSGCDGSTWIVELVDSGGLLESNPVQRLLKLKLTNNELCTAAFKKTKSFDISRLKAGGVSSVKLVLTGYNGSLLYKY